MKWFKTPSGSNIWIEKSREGFWLHIKNRTVHIKKEDLKQTETSKTSPLKKTPSFSTQITAPHPGRISSIPVTEGESVLPEQILIQISAMKMEHSLKAASPAKIKLILVKENQFVEFGQKLLILEKPAKP